MKPDKQSQCGIARAISEWGAQRTRSSAGLPSALPRILTEVATAGNRQVETSPSGPGRSRAC